MRQQVNRRTVSRHLTRLGLGKRRFIDPGGENNRKPGRITALRPFQIDDEQGRKQWRVLLKTIAKPSTVRWWV